MNKSQIVQNWVSFQHKKLNFSNESPPVKKITVYIKETNGNITKFTAEADTLISKLKELMEEHTHVPISDQRFIYNGKELEDEWELGDCKIKNNSTVYLIVGSVDGY